MRFIRYFSLIIVCSVVITACSTSKSSPPNPQLLVLAAASTRVLNKELAELSDQELNFVNAGSSTLVQQLSDGSPGDVLITADKPTMDRAVELQLVETPQRVATNHLVLITPKGNPAGITGADDSLRKATVVACDVQVPCGRATEKFVGSLVPGLQFQSREHSVTDVVGKVISNQADVGWVYSSDALAAGDTVKVFDIPGADEVPNEYLAAVVKNSKHRDQAQSFIKLLQAQSTKPIWSQYGFRPTE